MVTPRINVGLRVEPSRVSMAELPNLMIHGSVENREDRTIDTQVYASQLLINGARSMEWSLAIGNSPREQRESALPPGERVDFSRQMGDALFKKPGEYTVVLQVCGVDSQPVTVHVEP